MEDNLTMRRYAGGISALDMLKEIQTKFGPGAFEFCTVIDVADEMKELGYASARLHIDITRKQRDANLLAAEEAKLVCREVLAMSRTGYKETPSDKWDNLVEMARKVIG